MYAFPNLEPSTYELTATAAGFSTVKRVITLSVGQRVGRIKLQVGTTSTTVEVTEAAVQVNTETQSLSNLIGTRQVTELRH